ncbi:MAG TPA: TolC family protein [Thermoanaerobaculia bacterium]|nr:TolC family protein [Thermoanaerobaculia bacterium]
MNPSGWSRFSAGLALTALLAAAPAAAQSPEPGLGLVEAVRMMLGTDPNLSLEQARVRSARGLLLSTRGEFDPVLATSVGEEEITNPISERSSEEQRILTNSLGVTKRFRTGLSVEPGLSLSRTEETDAVNVGTFSFTVRQPLLRGRGRDVTMAPELSAEREVAASELDLRQTTAERMLAVVSQYWQTRAAALNLEILQENEDRSRELLETTRKLIEADVTPAAELVQVEANLVAAEASRIGGERLLFEAQRDLGREIGLDRASIAALRLPTDPFPTVPAAAVPAASNGERFVAAALDRRADLRAARERRNAAEVLLRAADDGLKPRLDLVWIPSYTGLVEGNDAGSFFSPLYRNVPGASSSFGLTLSWPTLNSQARGERIRIEAAREQSLLFEDLVARQIGADVPTALDAVQREAQRVERATTAIRLYEQTVINEEKKLRAGSSTLIDLISQRDRLTAARQSQVSANLALALALARLRFETGTLPVEGEPGPNWFGELTSVPSPDAPREVAP